MVRGRRKKLLSLISGAVVLIVLVTVSLRDGQSRKKSVRQSHGKDVRRSANGGANVTPFRYKIFKSYSEDDAQYRPSAVGDRNSQLAPWLDIRTFNTRNDQLLYLYDGLLASPWSSNPLNLAMLRGLLLKQTRQQATQDELILTQQNVRLGDRLPFAVTNTMSKEGLKVYFNVTQTFLDEIPKVSPISGKRFRRCSVVGNSGILRNSGCGKDIDKSDFIFRSNIPPLRPFAADAGRKSNLSTMNPSVLHQRYNRLKTSADHKTFADSMREYNGMLWMPCVGSHKMVDVCLLAKRSLDANATGNPLVVISNPNHFIAMQYFWGERNITQFLSTGFYLTQLALATCDETNLYGFWPFPTKVVDVSSSDAGDVNRTAPFHQRKVRYHYFDNLPGPNVKAHSMQDEFAVLVQMHQLGILKLHVHPCEE